MRAAGFEAQSKSLPEFLNYFYTKFIPAAGFASRIDGTGFLCRWTYGSRLHQWRHRAVADRHHLEAANNKRICELVKVGSRQELAGLKM